MMTVAILAVSLTAVGSLTLPAYADDNVVTPADTVQALADTSGVLGDSAGVRTSTDANSAATSTVDGTTVDVPKNASDGVGISTSDGTSLSITPPNADSSGAGTPVAAGTVAYPSSDGAATAVQATNDGGVRMLSVITNAGAPTDYPYNVSVPGGGSIQLVDGGGAVVVNSSGQAVVSIGTPWAADATGGAVQTWFTTDGTTLTQHVAHNVPGVAYPVTADPFWSALGNYLGCIFGVGVPIGAAIVIASLPATWPVIIGWAYRQSANGDRTIISYVTRVYNFCRRFIRS
jgi:hypothetical protein